VEKIADELVEAGRAAIFYYAFSRTIPNVSAVITYLLAKMIRITGINEAITPTAAISFHKI
jgi:hypothetical protein